MRGFRAEQLQALTTISNAQVGQGTDRVIYAQQSVNLDQNRYESAIYLANPGTNSTRVSPEGSIATLPRLAPDGNRFACALRDLDDDDAATRIAVIDLTTLHVTEICVPLEPPSELEWSPDGLQLGFVARDPDLDYYPRPGESRKAKDTPARKVETFFTKLDGEGWTFDRPTQVFVVQAIANAAPRAVTNGPFEASEFCWSPDGSRIACASARHVGWDLDLLRDLWVIDVATGAFTRITNTDAMYSHPQWSPDDRHIAALRYATPLSGPCHSQVVAMNPDEGAWESLTDSMDRNCVPFGAGHGLVWRDAESLYFAYEDGGRVTLALVNLTTCNVDIVVDGNVCVTELAIGNGTIATIQTDAVSIPELFIDNVRITDATSELFATTHTEPAEPQRFAARSSDGVEVECWAIRPEGKGPFPTILNIHGGPFTQYSYKLFDEFQVQAAAGFAVLYCNPRGSSGYSQQWGRAIRWPECDIDPGTGWGGIDYDDVLACADAAIRQFDWIDPKRLGLQGGSYGGYLTSWIIGHTDRFRAACSERSVNNLITEEHNSDVATSFREAVGASHLDAADAYTRQSPSTYVRQMKTPLLILHSEDDYRCPISQAEELFVALRLLGRTPEFWRFPGEGHELSRSGAPKHRIQRAEIILDFFTRHLAANG